MPRIEASFSNQQGESLTGLLEIPVDAVRSYALFAHCFTCSKDNLAAARIARALADLGIAVLRFDFTGLGNSKGDFSSTNFSSNLQDLMAAANYLEQQYAAPTLLIGHSLGGSAVLAVAQDLPAVKAVVTIGAPATAAHIKQRLNMRNGIIFFQIIDKLALNIKTSPAQFNLYGCLLL